MSLVELHEGQKLEDVADPGGSFGFGLVDHADEWDYIRATVRRLASSQQWAVCSACLDHWQQGEPFGLERAARAGKMTSFRARAVWVALRRYVFRPGLPAPKLQILSDELAEHRRQWGAGNRRRKPVPGQRCAKDAPKRATTRQQLTTPNNRPAVNSRELPSTRDMVSEELRRSEWLQKQQEDEEDRQERQRRWRLMRRGYPEQLLAIRRGLDMAANGERIPFRNFLRRAGFNYGAHCRPGITRGSPKTWMLFLETSRHHPSGQEFWTMQVCRDPDDGELLLSGLRGSAAIGCGDGDERWGQVLDSQNDNLIYQSLLSVIATADRSLLQFGQAFRLGWVERIMGEGE